MFDAGGRIPETNSVAHEHLAPHLEDDGMIRLQFALTFALSIILSGSAGAGETIELLLEGFGDRTDRPYAGSDPDVPDSGDLRLCRVAQPAYRLAELTSLQKIDQRPDERLARLMFDPLLERVPWRRAAFRPLIASAVTRNSDGTTVIIEIDGRARFSDDTPITQADVRASIALAAQRDRALVGLLENTEFANETTSRRLVLELPSPAIWNDLIVALAEVPIIPAATRQLIEANPADPVPPGIAVSGAYGVGEHAPGRTLSLVRRDDYWARALPLRLGMDNFRRVHLEHFQDLTARREALLAGICDFYFDDSESFQSRVRESLPEQAKGRIIFVDSLPPPVETLAALVFNKRSGAMRDPKLRHALQVAVSRANPGSEWPGLFNRVILGHEGVLGLVRNVIGEDVKARLSAHRSADSANTSQMLRDAGYTLLDGRLHDPSGKPVEIRLVLPDWASGLSYKELFAELGIVTRQEVFDSAAYWSAVRERNYDAAFVPYPALSRYPTREFLRRLYLPDGAFNFSGVEIDGVERLIDVAARTRSETEFENALEALDLLMWLESPFVLFSRLEKTRVTARADLLGRNFHQRPLWDHLDFRFWWRAPE